MKHTLIQRKEKCPLSPPTADEMKPQVTKTNETQRAQGTRAPEQKTCALWTCALCTKEFRASDISLFPNSMTVCGLVFVVKME